MSEGILLVDDHADIRMLIRITLGTKFEVLEASDGVTALAIAREKRPRVVILDVMMPGEMDGFQVLEAIRRDPALSDVRVMMVTARGQASDRDRGISLGADEYFIKPFSPLQVGDAIRALVG